MLWTWDMRAYLDIETSFTGRITVVGIYLPSQGVVQWVGEEAHRTHIVSSLDLVSTLVTYNGSRFDLPVIRGAVGVDLLRFFKHRDLMYECWRRGWFGGLKAVEKRLGIPRTLPDMNGRDAMRLWEAYSRYGDCGALDRLLVYNREDIVNLALVEKAIDSIPAMS
jgi:uncharacterized protein